jgi:hypothetical protein
MDAGDLRIFEAVARLGGMNRAAAELNTTSPTSPPASVNSKSSSARACFTATAAASRSPEQESACSLTL